MNALDHQIAESSISLWFGSINGWYAVDKEAEVPKMLHSFMKESSCQAPEGEDLVLCGESIHASMETEA